MLITLLAWVYISFVCYAWGRLFLQLMSRNNHPLSYGFSITCFIGLAITGSLAQIISLFTGLGSIAVQLIFLVPAVAAGLFAKQRWPFFIKMKTAVRSIRLPVAFVLATTLLMILVMSVYPVTHPDTLAYHAQLTKWAAQYGTVPGLVNVNYLYGLQNSWFLLCGLFSFSFASMNAVTFINTTVLVWLLLFVHEKINAALRPDGNHYHAFLWLALLAVNVGTFTQIPLTATSASPDFIATIYILLIGYLCLRHHALSKQEELVIIFLCFFTITIKLSAVPVVLLAFYLLYPFTRGRIAAFMALAIFVLVPFLARNVITSGHLFFPAAFADIFNVDWKYDTHKLGYINKFVLSFARTHEVSNPDELLSLPFQKWIPIWWHNLSIADKLTMACQVLCLAIAAISYKSILAETALKKMCLLTCLAGLFFWFVKAPDPRFGAGFLLLFASVILSGQFIISKTSFFFTPIKIVIVLCLLTGTGIALYTLYRIDRYFNAKELVAPEGIIVPEQAIYYKDIKTTIPLVTPQRKNISVVPDNPAERRFQFRGSTAAAGFTEKK